MGELTFSSLDYSHQMSDIWLIRGLRRTWRDLNGGFTTALSNVDVSVDRYTTQPITVIEASCGEDISL
jgi:hypothetical protein